MTAALPFINQRLDDARKPIDADLCLWLSGRKHPNLGFSGSLVLAYWGPYLDSHARQLTDLAFAAAKELAAEYGLDPYDTVEDAWNGAESAVQQVIDRMQDYDRRMRGKGFPESVPRKNVMDIRERHSKAIRNRAENERSLRRLPSKPAPQVPAYTAFVSHASEDKDEIARPLAEALSTLGHRIWFDEFTLKIGDSLRRTIDRGLSASRFGIVILSPSFLAKNWPQYELDGMVAKEVSGQKIILPIWHKLSRNEVLAYSPTLADRMALSTSSYTVAGLATAIHEVLSGV